MNYFEQGYMITSELLEHIPLEILTRQVLSRHQLLNNQIILYSLATSLNYKIIRIQSLCFSTGTVVGTFSSNILEITHSTSLDPIHVSSAI